MADQAKETIRVRVQRILSGSADRADTVLLLSDLRFRPGLPPDARDLGDFAAHRFDRDRGKAFSVASDLLRTLDDYLSGKTTNWSATGYYSAASVTASLKSHLVQDGIFKDAELADVSKLERAIALQGLVSMHGCNLAANAAMVGTLAIRAGAASTLEIGCMAPMPTKPDCNVNLCVFSTSVTMDATRGELRAGLPPSDSGRDIEIVGGGEIAYIA